MDIVEEIRTNRESGAKRLIAEYKAGLMTLARRFCHDPGDAEELVNRTFAAVVEGIDDYLEQSAFFAWMCQILTNIHTMDVRRKSHKNEVYPGVVPDVVDEEAQEVIYSNLDASLLREAIRRLPKEMKEVIVMYYLMDQPIARVAKFLSLPVSTVKWRLHCARNELARRLGAKTSEVAKKPGVKATLIALALCATAALGAVWWGELSERAADAAAGRPRSLPAAIGETGETSGSSGDSPVAATPTPVPPDSPVPPVADVPFVADVPSTTLSSGDPTMNTTLRTLAASAAFAAASAAIPTSATAAWFDSPEVAATVSPGLQATDPHFMNMSEDGAFLLVDWHAQNTALPIQLYSVPALAAASGATNRLAMASALAGEFFGAGTGDGGWKSGAISAKLGVAIPGSGKSSGALYTAFSVPSFGWKADETAFALSGLGDAGFDGLDFNASGTRLYANQYASGHRNEILAYDTSALKTNHTLSVLSTKTVAGVSRIRNLSCYTVKGKDLIYFGEGAVSGSNNSVYVYDPTEDTVTALVTDATLFDGDIMNVKLSHVATGCPTLYVQTDNGRLHVFLLAPDGKSVTSDKPVKSFTPAQCAALCGLSGVPSNASYVKFRNFEVTDDGETAFFLFLNGGDSGVSSPGLCVVKSVSTEDAYVSTSPEYTAKYNGNVLFTDYFFGANSRIEVDYAYLDANWYGFIFSPWEANSGSRSGIWRNNGTYTYFVGNRNAGIASVKLADTDRHTMCIDAPGMKGFIATGDVTNEVNFADYNITFSTSPWPIMFLGAANGSKTAVNTEHYARAKIYGAKIYESGVLVRDYAPAIVNGVPCLYDRVNGSIAAETRSDVNLPGFGGNVMRLTGETFIQLTAVSGDSSQKGINTGYCMKPTSRVELDCRLDANTPGDTRPIGAWNHAAVPKNLVYVNNGVLTFFLGYLGTWSNRSLTPFKPGTDRTTFVLDTPNMTSYVVKDGFVHYSIAAKDPQPTEDATEALALFADSNSADGTSFQSPALGMKAYSLAIRENGTIVTNFLPFLDISGACMKDVLTGEIIHPRKPVYFFYRLETASDATPGYIVKTTGERDVGFLTDWQFDAQSRVEEDFAFGSTANSQRPFGAWNNTSSKLRTLVWTASGKLEYFINSGSSAFFTSTATDIDWHKYVIDFTTEGAPTGYYYTGDTLTASG